METYLSWAGLQQPAESFDTAAPSNGQKSFPAGTYEFRSSASLQKISQAGMHVFSANPAG
ncbi:hypothetical protein [Agrobacterium albertimagni]|uniref:hypothetical protein n=1 Tax=Agrobacterium albertimagni TaxID=147266 RepID=UPI000591164C|nr:hypothetical protein [Agrobacterium albertimagni]